MGLDIVEIVIELEERFGIEIPDAEMGGVRTLGDLDAMVARRLELKGAGGDACPHVLAFPALRRAFAALGLAPLRRGDTAALLAPLIEPVGAPALWRHLESVEQLQLPSLVSSAPRRDAAMIAAAGVAAGTIGWATGVAFIGVLATIAAAIVVYTLVPRRPSVLPPGIATFGDLLRALVAHNPGRWHAAGARLDPAARWAVIVEVVSNFIGEPPKGGLAPHHALVDDLKLG
jgi:hypothetical protein